MSKFAGLGIAADKPFRVELISPVTGQVIRDKEGNPAYVDVLSSDSQKAREFDRRLLDRRIQNKVAKPDARQVEADSNERLVTLTVDWNLLTLDGEPLGVKFSAQNGRELYAEPAVSWVREQVVEAIDNRANFTAN